MKRDVSENSTKSIECFLSMNTDQKNMGTYIFQIKYNQNPTIKVSGLLLLYSMIVEVTI